MMVADHVPTNIPENLRHLASRLSWEDATHLLCLYEGWKADYRNQLETMVKIQKLIDQMRVLVRGLPYDWAPPPIEDHDVITALAAWARTGVMLSAQRTDHR